MLNGLRNEENRKIFSWLGGGIVVIVGGLWTAYTYLHKPSETSSPTPISITVGDIHSRGDTLVGPGTIDKRTYNYFGVTDVELAKQLGVAETAVKNFFKILDQKQVPMEEWEDALRKMAEYYKELKKRAALLESEDPEVKSLQEEAKQAIDVAEFEKAESLLQQAVDLDNAAAEQLKTGYTKRKRSAVESQALKAKSLHTHYALSEATESFKLAIEFAQQGEDAAEAAEYHWWLGIVYYDKAHYEQAIASYENALHYYLALDGEDSTDVAASRNNLGNVWVDKGDYDKAIGYYDKALAVFEVKLGPNHPWISGAVNDLKEARKKRLKNQQP